MSHAKYNGIARFRSGREGAMCNAKYNGNLAEAALAVLATTEHVSLTALANLRTTSHRLCDSITGHMPGKFRYNLVSRPDKIKVQAATCKPSRADHCGSKPLLTADCVRSCGKCRPCTALLAHT